MVEFDNLESNGYDLLGTVRTQGWEGYFELLKGPVYDELVKQLWIFSNAMNLQVTSYVLGHKISINEKSIVALLSQGGSGKWCLGILSKKSKMEDIVEVISMNGKPSSNPNNIHKNIRIYFYIIIGCSHPRPSSNSQDYINTDQST